MTDTLAKLRICLVSRKDLHRITRIARQARALVEAGHEVRVYCLGLPHPELLQEAGGVEFLAITQQELRAVGASELKRIRQVSGLEALPYLPRTVLGPLSQLKRSRLWRMRARAGAEQHLPGSDGAAASDPRALSSTGSSQSRRASRFDRALRVPGMVWRFAFLRSFAQTSLAHESLRDAMARAEAADVPVMHLHLAHRLHEHAPFAAAVLRRLEDEGRATGWSPDVVQAHDTHAIFTGAAIARSLGIPLVYDAVEIPEHQITSVERPRWADATEKVMRAAERPLIAEATRLVTIGDSLADWYRHNHSLKAPPVVVRNSRYYWEARPDNRLRSDCGISSGTPLIVWFGGAAPHRGMEFIVEALARLDGYHAAFITEFRPYWEPFRRELMKHVERCGVSERLHILPMRAPNDLIPYASGGDIGVFCFTGEVPLNVRYSLPNKFFEMVMARLPIAATPLDNVGQLIRKLGNGIEIPTDPAKAAGPIRALYAERHTPSLLSNLERAARELSWEHGQKALTDLYRELSEQGH